MDIQVKEGNLYTETERPKGTRFPRIIRIKRIEKMGPSMYVFFMAENQAAQSAHPNGGFMPLDSFLTVWSPLEPAGSHVSR